MQFLKHRSLTSVTFGTQQYARSKTAGSLYVQNFISDWSQRLANKWQNTWLGEKGKIPKPQV